eukprot:1723048-Prymnesium_polylepis.1
MRRLRLTRRPELLLVLRSKDVERLPVDLPVDLPVEIVVEVAEHRGRLYRCLLYTSDAADDM